MALEYFRRPAVRKALLLAVLLLGLWLVAQKDVARLLKNDFVPYWTAARLMLSGGNPYSPGEVLELQRAEHLNRARAWMMWNPPWALTVVLPFGMLPFQTAAILWFLLQFAILFGSSLWLWRIYRGPPQFRWLAIILPGMFLPVAVVLLDSQMTPLVLLGLVAFLHCIGRAKYKRAGIALALLALKPHLVIPLACAVLLWCIRERKWQVLACCGAGFAVLLMPVWVRPELIAQYRQSIPSVWDDAAPAWGGLMRALFGYDHVWLQYLPVIPGLAWTAVYWKRHRLEWEWNERLPMLLLAGFIAAPYAWTYDEVILLPAFISAAFYVLNQPERRLAHWAFGFYATTNLVMFALNMLALHDRWYIWNVPIWTMGYVLIRRHAEVSADPERMKPRAALAGN